MAGKATSVYITVTDKLHKMVEHIKFFDSAKANKWIKDNLEKYPKTEFYIVKETY